MIIESSPELVVDLPKGCVVRGQKKTAQRKVSGLLAYIELYYQSIHP